MNFSRLLAFGFLFWVISAQAQTSQPTHNLCFFSLNNSKEFELTRSFLEKARRFGGPQVNVFEFHDPRRDASPRGSFTRMIEPHQRCDGLVISGHHTGSFGGTLAQGVLDISFLEQLSCDAHYEDFFLQVKNVWLQGCRTLGVSPIEPMPDGSNELQADYHMQRVGAELIQDGLEQSFAELSLEFSATLDQDNPLASRYLRVFPSANVFGWTRSSPGEKSGSEKSLLYHMAHMAHLSGGVPLFDPLKDKSRTSMLSMSELFSSVLGGDRSYNSLAIDAWLSHGRVTETGLGFYNPDLNAYAPLFLSSDKDLLAAKTFGCDLRNSLTFIELQTALERILLDPTYVAYNFNVIWDVFSRYQGSNTVEYQSLKNQLLGSPALMSQLASKLKSPQTGLLMKIEYYSFYKDLTGNQVSEAETLILEHTRHFMLTTDLAGSQYDIRDFRESLLLSLASHHLADLSFYRALIRSPDAQASTLYTLTWSFFKESPEGAGSLMGDIVRHPKVDSDTLRGVALWLMNHGSSEDFAILSSIVGHPEVDEETLATVAFIVAKYNLEENEALVHSIVAHPKSGSLALSQASLAVRKYNIDVERRLLVDILSHPSLDKPGLQNVSRIIVRNDQPGDSELLTEVINHEQVDGHTLSAVAMALRNRSAKTEPQLLNAIRNHPRADARTLKYVDQALAKNQYLEQEQDFQ